MIDIFVISPYTDDDPAIIAQRVRAAEKYIANLTQQGIVAYSTIAAMDHIVHEYELRSDYAFWRKHCETMMECSKEVHVLQLDGWKESEGVQQEMLWALNLGKNLTFIKL